MPGLALNALLFVLLVEEDPPVDCGVAPSFFCASVDSSTGCVAGVGWSAGARFGGKTDTSSPCSLSAFFSASDMLASLLFWSSSLTACDCAARSSPFFANISAPSVKPCPQN